MTTDTTSHVEKKLDITINYVGREHPFHPEPTEPVLVLRVKAMDFFKIVADRERLRLYRLDNTELNDQASIGSYHLAEHEVLILRQPQGGGELC
jgi:hypothetical protein